jgi:hypothetical protein
MSNKLLDYVFPISVITPTPAASTALLKNVCIVVKPNSGNSGNLGTITLCTSMAEVSALTDNTEAQQLFNAGMNRVYVLLASHLDFSTYLANGSESFYTLLVSGDFVDADITPAKASGTITITSFANLVNAGNDAFNVAGQTFTAKASPSGDNEFLAATSNTATRDALLAKIQAHPSLSGVVTAAASSTAAIVVTAVNPGFSGNALVFTYTDNGTSTVGATVTGSGTLTGGDGLNLGGFDGVVGVSSTSKTVCAAQAIVSNRVAFFTSSANKAKNMFFAFGKLLSNVVNWNNQQYIEMPFNDGVSTLGDANDLFDSKVSFVLTDPLQYGNRLSLFAVGELAIIAPYIIKNLRIDLQSAALAWISGNQPQFTLTNASLLETRLQEDVINSYIQVRKWIEAGTIGISLVEDNFVATGNINIAQPKALWRVFNEMKQTL